MKIIKLDFKISILTSNLSDYSDAYILAQGIITVVNTAVQGQLHNAANKKVTFKICAPFTNWISRMNSNQVHNAYDVDIVMPMYSLIEYSANYSKTSGILW